MNKQKPKKLSSKDESSIAGGKWWNFHREPTMVFSAYGGPEFFGRFRFPQEDYIDEMMNSKEDLDNKQTSVNILKDDKNNNKDK